jgi:hypothetical protein
MSDINSSIMKAATQAMPKDPPQITMAMSELQSQITRFEDSVRMVMEKAAAVMTVLPSSPNGPMGDVPPGSPLAMEIWRKADDLRVANNELYQFINALDL